MPRLFFTLVFLISSTFVSSQDIATILEKHFEAHGQGLWDQIQTVAINGQSLNASFDKSPFRLIYKEPGKLRIEGKINGKTYIEATDGKIAWTVSPSKGSDLPQYLSPKEHLFLDNTFSKGSSLKRYEKKLELSGLEMYAGELFIKIKCQDEFAERTYYLGKTDYVLYWEVVKSTVGRELTITKQYEKYENFQGLLSPTAVRLVVGEEERELTYDDVALGTGANNKIFEIPKSH